MERLSDVWLELIFIVLAAIVYVTFSKKGQMKQSPNKPLVTSPAPSHVTFSKKAQKEQSPSKPIVTRPEVPQHKQRDLAQCPDQELTPSQLALNAIRQDRMSDAIALITRSPDCIRRMPNDLACRLLMSVAKAPKPNILADQLRVFTGTVSTQALDAALIEAVKGKDLEVCRQLHMISGILSIPKGQQSFDILTKAYASGNDASALRVLIEELMERPWKQKKQR